MAATHVATVHPCLPCLAPTYLAAPCHTPPATPSLARPRQAVPRRAVPAMPCLATPGRALPRLAVPALLRPTFYKSRPHSPDPTHRVFSVFSVSLW